MALEEELPALLGPEIAIHTARLTPPTGSIDIRSTFLQEMVDVAPTALRTIKNIDFDAVLFGCTSAEFESLESLSGLQTLSNLARPAPLFTPFRAIIAKFTRPVDAPSLFLIGGYDLATTMKERTALEAAGVHVIGHSALGYTKDFHLASARELLNAASLAGSASVLFSCTGLFTYEVLDLLRKAGVDAHSSNSCLADLALLTLLPPRSLEVERP